MDIFARPFIALCSALDRRFGWDRLPGTLGLLTLVGIRMRLRRRNLYDTGLVKRPPPKPPDVNVRTVDGSYNDLALPAMGSVGTRFGRNVPLERAFPEREPELLEPNPRLVSRELLTRRAFIPATTLNVLAAAWLQFEVHDWFSHETDKQAEPFELPLDDHDPWPERRMTIARTERDPGSEGDDSPPTFSSYDSHWWDGSQIYGSTEEYARMVRTYEDGKLRLDDDGLPPAGLDPYLDPPGIRGNFWVGLALLHALFMREHNAICDRLRGEHPTWSDDDLYHRARLINAAVMAKIHTVEWTPAVIAHPTTERAMHANWYGLARGGFGRRLGRLVGSDALSGIPGSSTDHHGVPFSLTEEFVAVYRMHPLIPDDYKFTSLTGHREPRTYTFDELGALRWRERLRELGVADAFYSLGNAHPGAITLHNNPRFLQEFRPGSTEPVLDLGAVDILRVRERGVPRYNEFRRLLHRAPVGSFEELTRDPATAAKLARVYEDVDRLDLMVGLFAEPRPKGFAFSDTAFRVFILMASRRLKSDRFFTRDFTAAVYTQTGLDWINDTTMVKVLLRHHGELEPVLRGVTNAFKPWARGSLSS